LAGAHADLGRLLAQTDRLADAEKEYREALTLAEGLAAEAPAVAAYQRGVAGMKSRLADLLCRVGRTAEAEHERRQVIAILEKLTSPRSLHMLAWTLATMADPRLRDPGRALEIAEKAHREAPESEESYPPLGVANYRVGHWTAAIEVLEKWVRLRRGGDPADWFFLAMAHRQNGDKEKARSWYDKAVRWMESNNWRDEELQRFRAEAAALLGVTDHATPTGNKEQEAKQHPTP
jgi:tetratricopeptide (TPR) repeat protein